MIYKEIKISVYALPFSKLSSLFVTLEFAGIEKSEIEKICTGDRELKPWTHKNQTMKLLLETRAPQLGNRLFDFIKYYCKIC